MSAYPYNALAPMERDEFQPTIPSLLAPTQSSTKYATPYSSIKAPLSKVDYVMRKSAPSIVPCTSCKLVAVEGPHGYYGAKFMTEDRNCTIYCLNNPALWLRDFMISGVSYVYIFINRGFLYLIDTSSTKEGVLFDAKAIDQVRIALHESFKRAIDDVSIYLNNDPVVLGIIYQLKDMKSYPSLKDVVIPKYGESYKREKINIGLLYTGDDQESMYMFSVGERPYHMKRDRDGRIYIQVPFAFMGSALRKEIHFNSITLFYI